MKTLILISLFLFPAVAVPQTRLDKEAKEVRTAFIVATQEYQASLQKLIALYEANVKRAEEKLEFSRRRASEGLIGRAEVEENERQLANQREKAAEAKQRLEDADKQLAAAQDEAKFIAEYKRAERSRKRSRTKPCANWDVAISKRQTAKSLTYTYRIVCR